jgi:hypothetical protein
LVVDAVVVMLLDDIKIMSFLFVSIRHSLRDDSTKRADRKKKGARSCTLNCLIFFTSACTACILGDVSEPSDTKIGNIHHAKKIYNDVKKKSKPTDRFVIIKNIRKHTYFNFNEELLPK